MEPNQLSTDSYHSGAYAGAPEVRARPPMSFMLRRYVRSLWHYTHGSQPSFEHVLPSPRVQLLINLAENELRHWARPGSVRTRTLGIALQGALTRRVLIDTEQKRAICGVEFEPGGSTAFHNRPATLFVDTIFDTQEIWGEDAAALRAELLR